MSLEKLLAIKKVILWYQKHDSFMYRFVCPLHNFNDLVGSVLG